MPNTGNVDERIVEMQIDHQKFEAGAKKTISILEKLDSALNSLGKNNSDGLDSITGSLEKVTNKFSVMGTVGDQVIRNLTNKAIALVDQMGRVAKSLSIDQVSAGWDKYAEKTQGVQTIMAATSDTVGDRFATQAEQMEWVNEELEKLNWFTDETSYNFLDMVNNIGKFTSNGVELETAVTAMQGISNWAAISGANVGEASRAMYNLSQAMAAGSVKLIDWKSIENANMATTEFKKTALETAVALGTLEKVGEGTYQTLGGKSFTQEQFNTQLSEGWFTSDVLLQTLDQYGAFTDELNKVYNATGLQTKQILEQVEAYKEGKKVSAELIPYIEKLADAQYELGFRAFRAAQEAKTFEDVINATKDSVSTAWMNLFETIFGDYLTAKKLWSDMAESFYNIFTEPVNKLIEIFDTAFGEKNPLRDKLAEVNLSMTEFEATASNMEDAEIKGLIEQYGSLEAALRAGAVSAELLNKVMMQLQDDKVSSVVTEAGGIVDRKIEEIRDAARQFNEGKLTKKEIQNRDLDFSMVKWWAKVYKTANKDDTLEGWTDKFKEQYFDEIAASVGYTEEEIARIKEILADNEGVIDGMQSEAVNRRSGLDLFAESLMNLLHAVENVVEAISGAFDIIFGDTNEQGEVIYGWIERFNKFTEGVKSATEDIEGLSAKIAGILSIFHSVAAFVKGAFRLAFHAAFTVVAVVASLLLEVFGIIQNSGVIQAFGSAITTVFQALLVPLSIIGDLIKDLFDKLFGNKLKDFDWAERLAYYLNDISVRVSIAASRFSRFLKSKTVAEALSNAFEKLHETVTKVAAAFSNGYKKLKAFVDLMKLGYEKNGIVGVFDILNSKIKLTLRNHPTLLKAYQTIGSVFKKIGETVDTSFGKVKAWFNNLVAFAKELKTAFQLNGLKGAFELLSSKVNEFLEKHPKIMGVLTGIQNAFSSVGTWIMSTAEAIKRWFSSIDFSKIGTSIQSAISKIRAFFASLKQIYKDKGVSGLWTAFTEKIKEGFAKLNLSTIFNTVKEKFTGFFGKIGEAFGKLSDIKLFDGDFFENLYESLTDWLHLFTGFAIFGLIRSAKKVINAIGDILKTLGGVPKDIKANQMGTAFLKLAGGILLIALSLKIISTIPTDMLFDVWSTIISLLIAIGAFAAYIKMIKGESALKSVLSVAAGIALLALTLYGLSKMTSGDFFSGVWKLGLIMVMLVGYLHLTDGIKVDSMKTLIGMAVGLLAMALVIKKLSKMSDEKYSNGVAKLFLIMAMMVGYLHLIDGVKAGSMKAAIGMAVGVYVLSLVVQKLSKNTIGKAVTGIVQLFFILAMMAGYMKIIDGIHISGTTLGAMALMILSVVVIAGALMRLTHYNWKALLATSGSIALCLVTIAGSIALVSKFADKMSLSAFTALAVGIAAFVVIAAVLTRLADYDWKTIGLAALTCVLTLAAVAGVVVLLGNVSPGAAAKGIAVLAIIAIGFGVIVVTLTALGLAAAAIAVEMAKKLDEFATAMQPFVNTISSFDDGTKESFQRFAGMMLSLLQAEFWMFLAGILSKLTASGDLGVKLSLFMVALQPFLTNVGNVTSAHVIGASMLSSVMKSIAGMELWGKVSEILNGLDGDIATRLSEFGTNLGPFLAALGLVTPEMEQQAGYLSGLMKALVKAEIWSTISEWINGLTGEDSMANFAERLNTFTGALIPFLTAMSSLNAGTIEQTKTTLSVLSDLTKNKTISNLGSQINSFYNNFNKGGKGANGDLTALKDTVSIVTDLSTALSNISTFTTDTSFGSDFMMSLSTNISNSQTILTSGIAVTVTTAISNAFAAIVPAVESDGYNVGAGVAQGMYNSSSLITKAGLHLARLAERSVASGLQIKSPSRVMAALAAYIPAGIAKGVEENSGVAVDSMTVLGSSIIAAMQMAMLRVATVADENFEFSPTITPVVDMSNVAYAAGNANQMFGSISSGLRGSMRITTENAANTAAMVRYGTGSTGIVDEIQNLSSKLDMLGEAVANMQIVLDTGELVGATSHKMDNAFGEMQVHRGRGN